jgi:hypothetical protein
MITKDAKGIKGIAPHVPCMWAVFALCGDGNEGLVSWRAGGIFTPLIATDPNRVSWLRQEAAKMAAEGVTVRLVKFAGREEIEQFHGHGRAGHA